MLYSRQTGRLKEFQPNSTRSSIVPMSWVFNNVLLGTHEELTVVGTCPPPLGVLSVHMYFCFLSGMLPSSYLWSLCSYSTHPREIVSLVIYFYYRFWENYSFSGSMQLQTKLLALSVVFSICKCCVFHQRDSCVVITTALPP